MAQSQIARANYGQDAPGVVRNLLIAAAFGLLLWGTIRLGLWSGTLAVPVGGNRVTFEFSGLGIGLFLLCFFLAGWMVWDSRVGKLRSRDHLLAMISWTGAEQVLDLGCGRGLLLIGAARHLTSGKAVGIDIWQTQDLTGNSPEATLENARIEGVQERIELKTADMRHLPFPDDSFDVVLSRAAIHNLYRAEDRAKAIEEIGRVLRPGGHAIIDDIRHGRQYAQIFAGHRCEDIQRLESPLLSLFTTLITGGSLRPATLLVKKT